METQILVKRLKDEVYHKLDEEKETLDNKLNNKIQIKKFSITVDNTSDTMVGNDIYFNPSHKDYIKQIEQFIIDNYNKIIDCRLIVRLSSDPQHVSLNFPAYCIPNSNYSAFNIFGLCASDTSFSSFIQVMLLNERIECNIVNYINLIYTTNSSIDIIFIASNDLD
jgi:hypothetical protein